MDGHRTATTPPVDVHGTGVPRIQTCGARPARLVTAIVVLLVAFVAAPTARADVPAGDWAPDGVTASVEADDATYLAGVRPTRRAFGGGVLVSRSGTGRPAVGASPRVNGTVAAVVDDGAGGWFIGGRFSHVDGVRRHHLAHIEADGSLDRGFDPGGSRAVRALTLRGTTLYVGGDDGLLEAADTSTGKRTDWRPEASPAVVVALAVAGDRIVVARSGEGDHDLGTVRLLDPETGAPAGRQPDLQGAVRDVAVTEDRIYVSGSKLRAAGDPRSYEDGYRGRTALAIERSDDRVGSWRRAPDDRYEDDESLEADATSIAVDGDHVYVGGSFKGIGGQPRQGLAALAVDDGRPLSWRPDVGRHGRVESVAVDGGDVLVGGELATGDDAPIAVRAFDRETALATTWDPGVASSVEAIAVAGGRAYLGGGASGAGPTLTTSTIFRVLPDGSLDTDWRGPTLAPSVLDRVDLMTAIGPTIYIWGHFEEIDGELRNGLAAFDTATGRLLPWNPELRSGAPISSLVATSDAIYIAGGFDTIGGAPRGGLAALDPTTGDVLPWKPDTPQRGIQSLAVRDDTVYVGGEFLYTGGAPRQNAAAFSRTTGALLPWQPEAAEGRVETIVPVGDEVYLGGSFRTVGGRPHPGMARVDARSGAVSSWRPILEDTAHVTSLAVGPSTVYAATGDGPRYYGGARRVGLVGFSRGDDASLSSWDSSLSGWSRAAVQAVTLRGSTLHVAGYFGGVGPVVAGGFASLDTAALPTATDSVPPTGRIVSPAEGSRLVQGSVIRPVLDCRDEAGGSGVDLCGSGRPIRTVDEGYTHYGFVPTDREGNVGTGVDASYDVVAPGGPVNPPTTTGTTPGPPTTTGTAAAPPTTTTRPPAATDPPPGFFAGLAAPSAAGAAPDAPTATDSTTAVRAAMRTALRSTPSRLAGLRSRRLRERVPIVAPATGVVSATATHRVRGRTVVLATGRRATPAGRRSVVVLRGRRAARSTLRSRRMLTIRVTLRFRSGGRTVSAGRTVRVRPAKR